MSLPFKTLQEFTNARDKREIVLSDFCGLLDKLNFKKLVAVLTRNLFIRIKSLKNWIREVGQLCGIKIKLKISLSAHRPYMTEKGDIGLWYGDLFKTNDLFFAIVHESAHFILTCNEAYALLKVLDKEYPSDAGDRQLRSPIEYCANVVTLMILERCLTCVKKERHKARILHYLNYLQEKINK